VRVEGEVVVLDAAGRVVATTGREYYISNGRVASESARLRMERVGAFPAAANCGYPWDFIDCTAAADGTGDPGAAATYCGAGRP
jgi:hypothetical protein